MMLDLFKKKEDPDDILMELGIWTADDFHDKADEADDEEESEDDWSIKTFEAEVEEVNEIVDYPVTPPPTPPPEPPPKTPPHFIQLPVGDTPDILHCPTSTESEPSSSYSVYASNFDEYESDVFGSRLQENIFFQPQSLQSEAGDSDMFYCVPIHKMQFDSGLDQPVRKSYKKKIATDGRLDITTQEGGREKKRKKRRVLDERFVDAFMKRNKVQDTTIVQYGGATKAFRLVSLNGIYHVKYREGIHCYDLVQNNVNIDEYWEIRPIEVSNIYC